jgi:cytochrome b6-f complex iron-sulfur subunit
MNKVEDTRTTQKNLSLEGSLKKIQTRRKFFKRVGWSGVSVFFVGTFFASIRFFYPRVLFEPPSRLRVGRPSEYPSGTVNTQYKDKYGIWIVRRKDGNFFCLSAKCTHLGCIPNWLSSQRKFKCPCHGSGFFQTGDNFEGPAPRPLDRFKISLSGDGQLVVDKGIIYPGVAGVNSDEFYPQSFLKI